MKLTSKQYALIKDALSVQRGNVKINNEDVLNASFMLQRMAVRALPERFGNWHTLYTHMSRWSEAGVLRNVFEQLQLEQALLSKIDCICLDSTSIKVHPDGMAALKKRPPKYRQVMCELDN